MPESAPNTESSSKRSLLTFLVLCLALLAVGLAGGSIALRRLRIQLYGIQAESERRHAESMSHVLERDLETGKSPAETIARLQAATLGMGGETDFLCLLDEHGKLLSHPNPSMVGRSKAAWQVGTLDGDRQKAVPLDQVLAGRDHRAAMFGETLERDIQLVYFQPVQGTSWTLTMHEDAEAVSRQVRKLGWQLASIAIPTVAIMAALGTFLARALGRRYERQIETANAELEQRVDARTKELREALTEVQAAHQRLIQSDKMHLLGELMAGIAHEINNPLTILQGYASLYSAGQYGPEVKQSGGQLLASVERVRAIVDSLLSFARNKPPARRMTPLAPLVNRVLGLIGAELRLAQITVVTDVAAGLEPLCIDEQQMEQVLLNLLNNARQALVEHPGERRINLTLQEEGDDVVLSVADTGPGLTPEVRRRLFQPFVSTKAQGNGLGLSLCRRFIEALGGRIESPPTKEGTRFVIHLPRTILAKACVIEPAPV